jgi:amino acid adenylation domain-containing protein
MLRASGVRVLVVEARHLDSLKEALARVPWPIAIVVTDLADVTPWASRFSTHAIYGSHEVMASEPMAVTSAHATSIAYLMFTSGSTGTPKGVMVSNANVMACMASFGDRYDIGPDDRFSQNFELTFDLSVFDMFLCWLHGASLHVPPTSVQTAPAKTIIESELTVWFSVPAMALFMRQMRLLKPGAFPSLRWSLFCGERLPLSLAEVWADAAPRSSVENLYGPTEVTIACTVHRFERSESARLALLGSVPVGTPLPGLTAAVVDDALAAVPAGETGELCMAGPQVSLGYWEAPEKTAERFVHMPWDGQGRLWYRTGDLATLLESGELAHLGRADDQVKVKGYRIELGEVDFALRRAAKTEAVASIAVPSANPDVVEIVAFMAGAELDADAVRQAAGEWLPVYMQPTKIIRLDALPLSSNGKFDKGALRRIYLEEHAPKR